MKRSATVILAVIGLCVGLAAVIWAVHNHGRSYPAASKALPTGPIPTPPLQPGLTHPTVTTDGTSFVEDGHPVVLRGFDLNIASPPVYQQVEALHANFVRIAVPWKPVEPTRPTGPPGHLVHHWDTSLLSDLDQQVAALGAHHIQVLIDFHQFHWSPYYAQLSCKPGKTVCHGTGVPAWFYQGRYPATAAGASAAKTDFWTRERQTSLFYYSQFAEMMARRYGRYPNVVGYEIFNEPHTGHLPDDTATTNVVLRWEAQIARLMHAVDPSRTVFIMCRGGGEGIGTADLSMFHGSHFALDFHDYYNGKPGTGFDAAGDNWVPSWNATHNQDLNPLTGYDGSEAAQARVLSVAIKAAHRADMPLLVGEWGIHKNDANAEGYTAQMLQLFNSTGVSWARWVLAPGGGFNLLNPTMPHSPGQQASQIASSLGSDSSP